MRWILMAVGCFLLASCGAPVTMYTDETFRNAAPEVVEAWGATAPWKPASVKNLPPGSGTAALEAELVKFPGASVVLVGMALSESECRALQNAHPKIRMFFFTSSGKSDGLTVVTVRRQDAWSTVAKKAVGPGAATVFYPSDVKTDEMEAFETAWNSAGGGPLTTAVGYQAEKIAGASVVFHWAGPELDGPVQALNPSIKVHGNPGTARAPGASGLTWALKKAGLGDFLWQAALDPEKKSHFLPLETVLERR